MIHRENQARASAILSSALLIISVVGLAGRPAAAAPHSSLPARLLPLVDDLDAQLRLSYEFNRPVYRERVQYTLAVIRAWQQSAQSPRDEALLEGWLHDAIERSLPGRRARLAAIPGFRSPPVDLLPAAEDRSPAELPSVQVEPPIAQVDVPIAQEELPSMQVEMPSTQSVDRATRPEPTAIRPPRRRRAEPPQVAGLPREDEPSPPAVSQPGPGPRGPHVVAADPPLLEPPRTERAASPSSSRVASPSAALPSAVETSVSHDPAKDGLVMQDLVLQDRERRASPVHAELDLNEYAARVAGHRRGLRRLEVRLLDLRDPTADELARFVSELENLYNQKAFLALYTGLLPADATLSDPASPAEALATLNQRIQDRRAALERTTIPAAPRRHAYELNLLELLAKRIARLTDDEAQGPAR